MVRSMFGDDVGATLVTPLYARAHAQRVSGALPFDDRQARQVWARLEEHASSRREASPEVLAVTDSTSVLGTIRRSLVMDRATWKYVIERPGAQVVTLGLGLCNRRSRLADLDAEFIGVDRAPVMRLRRELMPDDSTRAVKGSAVDRSWLAEVDGGRPTLVIAEGLFMYLPPHHVARLLRRVGAHFGPGTRLLADVFHPMAVPFGHPINATTGALFHSGHAGADGLAAVAPGWQPIDNADIMRYCGFLPAQWNTAFRFLTGKSMYTVAEIEFVG